MSNNNYDNITIYELNLLYLESNYYTCSLKAYGILQDRANVVNEYLGNIKVKYIDSNKVEEFRHYLLFEKEWKYLHGPNVSETQIDNIMNYLDCILESAIAWKIIEVNPLREIVSYRADYEETDSENEGFIRKRHELLSNAESKRVSDVMNTLLNPNKKHVMQIYKALNSDDFKNSI